MTLLPLVLTCRLFYLLLIIFVKVSGSFESDLILKTLASHFKDTSTVPPNDISRDEPCGALLAAVVAVCPPLFVVNSIVSINSRLNVSSTTGRQVNW